MKIREFLTQPKDDVIKQESERLKEFKSYKNGTRCPDKQAQKYYIEMERSLGHKKWFKIIIRDDYPTIIWSLNGSTTTIIYGDGSIKYNDEIEGKSNYCRVVGASSRNHIPFYGSLKEAIYAVENDKFDNNNSNLLQPVEFMF